MTATGSGVPVSASPLADEPAPDTQQLGTAADRATAAWLSAIPCTALVAAAAYVLGPPLGRAFLAPSATGYTFTPDFAKVVRPEPTEHARFLIALTLPLLIAGATIAAPRWLPRLPRGLAVRTVVVVQAALAGLFAACYVAQVRLRFGAVYTQERGTIQLRYFTTATLVAAALLAGAALLVVRRAQLRAVAASLLRESRTLRGAALVVAIAATAIWMLHAVYTDGAIANAPEDIPFHLSFPLDETFAVINGMNPLVDFSAQYGSLWPYVMALPLLALGKTLIVFSLAMCTLTGLALLSIFGVLRRVVRSSVAALGLYLPFLATSLFMIGGTIDQRSTVGTFYGTFPLRYAVPYFLALLTARRIDKGGYTARSLYPLFVVGGLGILNNADFSVAAVGATIAALIWSQEARLRPSPRAIAVAVAGGLLTALALVSALTLVRAGSLPHLWRLVDFARLFTLGGFAMMPIPGLLGVHMIVYLTYVAAIAVATVRALRGAGNRVLTGMLAWAGIFGLGSASYYVGRSHPVALRTTFSVWALTLALLTVVVVRQLAARPPRRVTIAAVAVLFGFGVATCSLAQTPLPWTQLHRLNAAFVAHGESISPLPLVPSRDPRTRFFVASLADGYDHYVYKRGAPIAILLRTGHRIADAYGVRNVSSYTGIDSTPTVERVEADLDRLEAAGGNTAILPAELDFGTMRVLERRGFMMVTPRGLSHFPYKLAHSGATILRWPYGRIFKWVDTRHLHPRALG
jgi:hypothetical protein